MPRGRYPRKGHRLAPVALSELLQDPIPPDCLVAKQCDGDCPNDMLLADLDETAWDRFDEATCERLAKEILAAIGRIRRLPTTIGTTRLPAIPEGMSLADLWLESRTYNSLAAVGIHQRPQDLRDLTIEGVLGLRGFWVKSLLDLLTSLEYARDHAGAIQERERDPGPFRGPLRQAERYPRKRYVVAPETLRELLLDPIPATIAEGTSFEEGKLCDLDHRAWDCFSPEAIELLGNLVTSRAGNVLRNRAVLMRHLPRLPDNICLEDLRLENRTRHCLQKAGLASRLEDLERMTIGDLLAIRSFGSRCLVDLLSSVETLIASAGRMERTLTAEAKRLADLPEASRIVFGDPRLGVELRAMDNEANTIAEMADRLMARSSDPPDAIGLCGRICELRAKIAQFSELSLEEELIGIFATNASERDRQIVAEYHGWCLEGKHTLEVLGKKYGLSRERVRQICVRAVDHDHHPDTFAPVLDRALSFVAERIPSQLHTIQGELDARGYSTCGLSLEALLRAAKLLSRKIPCEIVDMGQAQLVVEQGQSTLPSAIGRAARQAITNYGVAKVADVSAKLRADSPDVVTPASKSDVSKELICETLSACSDFRWLDERRTWYRLDVLPQYGLPNIVDKILSVAKEIDVSAMRIAVARYRRNGRTPPPPAILAEFCKQIPGVRVEGNTVISETRREWREVLAGVERGLVAVLTEHGPAMERTEFEQMCVTNGMNRFSFNAMVMCSPVIAQYGRSVYGLVGAKVAQKTIDVLVERGANNGLTRVLHSHGHTDDGRPYLAYRLSKASISGGVITVPAAMKEQVHGKFVLRTDRGHDVGTLVAQRGCGWGLGPALRGSDAAQGDHMLLLFDIERREASIHIGDETLVERIADEALTDTEDS